MLGKRVRRAVCTVAPLIMLAALGTQATMTAAQAAAAHSASNARVGARRAGPPSASAARAAGASSGRQDRLADPQALLPAGWRTSPDRAVAVAGDATGLHVLVAKSSDGYAWQTVATLAVRGTDTSQWIGQACLTGSGKRAVVVYAPRQITNAPDALGYGALAAVVNLATGEVRQLGAGVSIAYFNPGCGTRQSAVLTQGGTGASPLPGAQSTRLMVVNTVTGKISATATVAGQVTSAVPFSTQIAGVRGGDVVSIGSHGSLRTLAAVAGQAYDLAPDASGGLGFLVAAGKQAQVRRWAAGRDELIGSAALTSVGLTQVSGQVFLTGEHSAAVGRLPGTWRPLDVPAGAAVSSTGMLAVTLARSAQYGLGKSVLAVVPDQSRPVQITARVPATARSVTFTVPAARPQLPGTALPSALPGFPGTGNPRRGAARQAGGRATSSGVSPPPSNVNAATTTYDPDRSCSVPRNDAGIQTYQPSAQQIEWAADQAVQNKLTTSQPANLYGSGLPAYSPQGLFPGPGLTGGGSVPAQVLLGILAQESNEDQASDHDIIGQTGNFNPSYNWYGDSGAFTYVDFSDSDCGYGIAQVTSGMCLSGYSDCTSPLPYENQLAVAVDYEANIAAGLQILEQKWNQLHALGITANGGDPKYVEDWWFALWAYNSGVEPNSANGNTSGCSPGPSCTDSGGNWGLGWVDNPANPLYPPGRPMFLAQGPSGSVYNYDWDEAHPAGWSYEEKVIGFGAYGLVAYSYVNADWAQAFALTHYPPEAGGTGPAVPQPADSTFCSTASGTNDHCNPSAAGTATACSLTSGSTADHCWWHWPVTWTTTCSTYCGTQVLTYAAGAANPGDPGVPAGYAPDCSSSPLPASAVIVGDTAASIAAPLGCGTSWSNNGGTMTWKFASNGGSPATYPSKIDFHQSGTVGYGGHFWFTHTIPSSQASPTPPISTTPSAGVADLAVTGTWKPPTSVSGWTRIMVAIPTEGSWDPQANYRISLGNGTTQSRIINQAYQADTWVSLGIYDLSAGASVSLSNVTFSGLGYDISWDAMAFVPASSPGTSYVAMGDSYSSGEGLQPFDANSDYNYSGQIDACHRSGSYGAGKAYSQLVTMPGQSQSIAKQAASASGNTQYSFLACSGDFSTQMGMPAYDTGVSGGTVSQAAMTNTVWDTFKLGQNELPQASDGWLGSQTTLVTLTAGGDDARFASVLKACLLSVPWNDCTASDFYMTDSVTGQLDPEPLYQYEPAVLTALQPHLQALYAAIAKAAPNAKLIVLGYPRLFPGDTNAPSCNISIAGFTVPVVQADVTSWINKMGDVLNTTISNAVAAEAKAGYNVHFIDPNSEFTGHEVCSSAPWINGIIAYSESGSDGGTPTVPGAGSFHPMAAGQQEFATLVDDCLASSAMC